ncbi:MAG: hypothetical protein C4329_02960 [Chitinophagaceae bacterium]
MTKILTCALAICRLSCNEPNTKQPVTVSDSADQTNATEYVSTKLPDSAAWKKSYNFQMLSLRDTLWTFHYDGNWYSTNEKDWTKSALSNAIGNIAFVDYVPFKNAVYGIGHFEGNIERFTLKQTIYKSTDLRHWDTVATQSKSAETIFLPSVCF